MKIPTFDQIVAAGSPAGTKLYALGEDGKIYEWKGFPSPDDSPNAWRGWILLELEENRA